MKSQHRKHFLKMISLLLAIILSFPVVMGIASLRVRAENENEINAGDAVAESINSTQNKPNEVQPQNICLLDNEDVPPFISQGQIEEHGHIMRISDEEDLNTLVYQNSNGTKTVYIMDNPIKFTDKNGKTQFIDLTLQEETDRYRTAANDITMSAFKDAANGIVLTDGDIDIRLVAMPNSLSNQLGNISTAPMITTSVSENSITYENMESDALL